MFEIYRLNKIHMQKKYSLWMALLLSCATTAFAQLKSPDEFLPHRWGENFTPHHLLADYVAHVAANSNHVKLIPYGRTNEARPLMIAVVSTPENLARIEDIRTNNLRRAGTVAGAADAALDRAIVWLSFSVHGNEAPGSEASMAVLYDLVNPANPLTKTWLKNTIVIIDPSLNPDGYSRYTHWFRGVANRIPDANPAAREHREPWPGGRVNHYYFDLNRDWAWQTQVESQQTRQGLSPMVAARSCRRPRAVLRFAVLFCAGCAALSRVHHQVAIGLPGRNWEKPRQIFRCQRLAVFHQRGF
jgi:hypothetical protein